MLIGAGIPLVTSLETLSRGDDPLSARVMPLVSKRVSQGSRLSVAFKAFPRVFPATYIWLVNGAEETGTLHRVFEHLADWLERQDKLTRQVLKALTYPGLVLAVTLLLTIGLFRTVIPSILEAVLGVGAVLPLPTKILLVVVALVQNPWTYVLTVILMVVMAGYLRSPKGRRLFSDVLLGLPVMGELLRFGATARMSLTLSMLLEAGINVTRACFIAGSAGGLPQMTDDTTRIRSELREGRYLSQIYQSSSLYPPLLCDMLKAGEESGRLAPLIRQAGELFEEETYGRLETFASLLEPIVLAGISLGVGFILIAVMMPMTAMLSAL